MKSKVYKEERVKVTPAIAKEWLQSMNGNRKVKEQYVGRLTKTILAGDWLYGADAIKFNDNGKLIDGQHRLLAIAKSKKSVVLLVSKGLKDEVMEILDTGIKRSFSDILLIKYPDTKNVCIVAATVKKVWAYNEGVGIIAHGGRNGTATFHELLTTYENNKGINNSAAYARGSNVRYFMNGSLLASFHYILHNINGEGADIFFTKLTGVDIKEDSSIFLFRKIMMLDKAKSKKEIPIKKEAALFIKAWNYFLEDKKVKKLSWSPWRDEKFPKIEEGE